MSKLTAEQWCKDNGYKNYELDHFIYNMMEAYAQDKISEVQQLRAEINELKEHNRSEYKNTIWYREQLLKPKNLDGL